MQIKEKLLILKGLLKPHQLFLEYSDCLAYSYDNSRYTHLPDAVSFPETHEDVVKIVEYCYQNDIPITARGRGTNTTGSAIPTLGGLVISLERMQKILRIDAANRTATVEAGVINQDLQDALLPMRFFWPPDPTSAAYSSIGGNIACNAGGPRALKYGACRENVLALKAVTGDAKTIHTGFNTSKASSGYDLTKLLVGSEGTLAIITEATLKLLPIAPSIFTASAFFSDELACTEAIAALMQWQQTPYRLEFMDAEAIEKLRPVKSLIIPPESKGFIIVEYEFFVEDYKNFSEQLRCLLLPFHLISFSAAYDSAMCKALWDVRKALSPALKAVAPIKINEDVVVPVSCLPKLMELIQSYRKYEDLFVISFGHAGNGNLHVNFLYDPLIKDHSALIEELLANLFQKVVAMGGTLSGEHGIGIDKSKFLHLIYDDQMIKLLSSLKKVFDPKGILNPGKIFPARDI